MEVTDGNDDVLAAGIVVAAMMQLFFCDQETSHVGTSRVHTVLNTSPSRKCTPYDMIYQGTPGRGERMN